MSSLRTFMYHDVRDAKDTKFPERYNLKSFLNLEQFDKQVKFIAENYDIISPHDYKFINFNEDDDHKFAILTFDDGLVDHYNNVLPILKNYSVPGTFFIPVEQVTKNTMIHSHKIQFILAASNEKELVKDILSNFTDNETIWPHFSHTEWKDNWWSKEMIFVTNFLRNYDGFKLDKYSYTDELFEKYVGVKVEEFAKDFYLKESHIDEMRNETLVTIGGHGYTSENLLLIDDFEDDIKKCAEFIKSEFISYPNGGYNDEIKQACKKYGFNYGFTIEQKTITELDLIDNLEMPRYDGPQKLPL